MSVHFKSRGIALLTTVSALILVGTEILGVAIATGWAVGGLLELGPIITFSLSAILFVGGLVVLAHFARKVIGVEMKGEAVEILERQPVAQERP